MTHTHNNTDMCFRRFPLRIMMKLQQGLTPLNANSYTTFLYEDMGESFHNELSYFQLPILIIMFSISFFRYRLCPAKHVFQTHL